MRILIVEDDENSRVLLATILDSCGYQTNGVSNGVEALTAITHTRPDLIISDIMMPEMDGQQALRNIRAQEEARGIISSNGAKIVMTTALGDIKNVSAAYSGLCDGYLTKPIQKAKLLEELRKLGLMS